MVRVGCLTHPIGLCSFRSRGRGATRRCGRSRGAQCLIRGGVDWCIRSGGSGDRNRCGDGGDGDDRYRAGVERRAHGTGTKSCRRGGGGGGEGGGDGGGGRERRERPQEGRPREIGPRYRSHHARAGQALPSLAVFQASLTCLSGQSWMSFALLYGCFVSVVAPPGQRSNRLTDGREEAYLDKK